MFKSLPRLGTSGLLVRPSVLVAITWLVIWSAAFIFHVLVMQLPGPGGAQPFRLLSTAQFSWLSAGNALLLAGLCLDGVLARSSPQGLRRAHWTGLVGSLILLALFQYGLVLAWRPIVLG